MASNRGQLMQSFMFTISEDLKLYRQLHTLLTEQKALYLQFNGDALGKNIRQQVPVLNQLHRNASHRTQCLQRLALPNSDKGVLRLFSALPASLRTRIEKQWQVLNLLIQQCQRLNQDNGLSSATFHELLSELTQPSPTYEERIADAI